MKAFKFAGSLMSLALYLVGGDGAAGSFCFAAVCIWEAIKAILAAGLAAGLSVLEFLVAAVAFVLGCIIGTGTLIYSGAYYTVIGIIWAVKWFFDTAAYDPDIDYPLY